DIWLLSRQYDFDGRTLATAVTKTFANRQTTIPPDPFVFSSTFQADATKATQWRAFLRKSNITGAPTSFDEVVKIIADFLLPVITASHRKEPFNSTWPPAGPWRSN